MVNNSLIYIAYCILHSYMQEWADLVQAYERSNVYLAECGQYLARLVNYEIPTTKQQISRSKQAIRVMQSCHYDTVKLFCRPLY